MSTVCKLTFKTEQGLLKFELLQLERFFDNQITYICEVISMLGTNAHHDL